MQGDPTRVPFFKPNDPLKLTNRETLVGSPSTKKGSLPAALLLLSCSLLQSDYFKCNVGLKGAYVGDGAI